MKWIVVFVFLSTWPVLMASEISPKKAKKQELKQRIIKTHNYLSKKFMIPTNWIDSFFGNIKHLEDQNGSRFRLYHISSQFEREDIKNAKGFRLNLRFPNIQKRLQFSLEKNARTEDRVTPTPESGLNTERPLQDNDLRSSLSFFIREFEKFNIKLKTGIRMRIPPELYTQLRVSRVDDFGAGWSTRFSTTTFWEQVIGVGQSVTFDIDKLITPALTFRFANESTWLDESDEITGLHGPSLYHKLGPTRAVSYNFRTLTSNRPDYRVVNYAFSMVFRQNLLEQWFYFEIIPQWDFARVRHFKSRFGGAFKLELAIGEF